MEGMSVIYYTSLLGINLFVNFNFDKDFNLILNCFYEFKDKESRAGVHKAFYRAINQIKYKINE